MTRAVRSSATRCSTRAWGGSSCARIPDNEASQRLAERCGFRARGHRAEVDLAARAAGRRDRVVAAAGRSRVTLHSLRTRDAARDPDPARARRPVARCRAGSRVRAAARRYWRSRWAALGIAFLLFNDPRSGSRRRRSTRSRCRPARRSQPRWRQALAATLPSTVGRLDPGGDRRRDATRARRVARRCLRRPRPGRADLALAHRPGPVRRPEERRHLPGLRPETRGAARPSGPAARSHVRCQTRIRECDERSTGPARTAWFRASHGGTPVSDTGVRRQRRRPRLFGSCRSAHYATRVQNWRLTELDSGERVISERLEHVRSAAVGYWIGAGSRDEGAERGRRHALHRAPALQGHGAYQRARDRRDLRRARRRAERGHVARAHARLRARARPPSRDRDGRDGRHGVRAVVRRPRLRARGRARGDRDVRGRAAGSRSRPDRRGGVRRPPARPAGDRHGRGDLVDPARRDRATTTTRCTCRRTSWSPRRATSSTTQIVELVAARARTAARRSDR